MKQEGGQPLCLPLYRGIGFHRGSTSLPWATDSSNVGLLFDKYLDAWSPDPQAQCRLEGQQKELFLKAIRRRLAASRSETQRRLDTHLARHKELVRSVGGRLLFAQTAERLVSGLGNGHPLEVGLVWHRTLGVPYLPGSTVKGVVRSWADEWGALGKPDVARLFGDLETTGAGLLCFFDALPTRVPELEIDVVNPHYGAYYQAPRKNPPADYLSPVPVKFLTVAPGTEFCFAVALRPGAALVPGEDPRTLREALETGVWLLAQALTFIGAGAKTAVGYGTFEGPKAQSRPGAAPDPQPGEPSGAVDPRWLPLLKLQQSGLGAGDGDAAQRPNRPARGGPR